jgi:hypothetical protein
VRGRPFLAALILAALPADGLAQDAQGIQIFSADYFAALHPADALDMVRKLPGFELIDVDEDVRGFTGSRGNVLFDGRAPSGKQESLEEMLRRIPAASVLRIELIRGGSKSAATGSYDLVANIVRRSLSATNGSMLGGLSAADEIGIKPDLRVEMSRETGSRRLDAALALATDIDDDSGHGAIVERDTTDALLNREDRDEREVERKLSADAEYNLPLGPGDLVTNLNVARERTFEQVRSGAAEDVSLATGRDQLWTGEAGAQYRAELGGEAQMEALAVQRLGRLRIRDREDEERFTEARRTSETIARAEYRRGTDHLRLFGSVEGALNRLSSATELTLDGAEIPLRGSDVSVSERRAEGALGATWQAGRNLTVEPSLRAEISNIRSTGDSPQNDSFLFWKPRVRLSWDHGSRRVQATVEREAAQLDFGDYVASAELDRDDVTAGALALRPPTTWSVSATVEQRFWGDGVLLLTFRHEWIDDALDKVAVEQSGELFDAVGNIGKGRRRILKAELTAPFDRIGIAGMQLKALLTFIRSRVTDPITGLGRIIAEDRPFEGDLSLTHDVPGGRWSWGAEASLGHREREFRFDEARLERKGTSIGAHVEFRPRSDLRIRLEAENLTSRRLTEIRDQYDGLRSTGSLESIETRRIRTAPIVMLSVRRSFGAAAED